METQGKKRDHRQTLISHSSGGRGVKSCAGGLMLDITILKQKRHKQNKTRRNLQFSDTIQDTSLPGYFFSTRKRISKFA